MVYGSMAGLFQHGSFMRMDSVIPPVSSVAWSTQRRFAVATRLMEQEQWDFFHLHIMGTDRINHFLWRRWEDGDPCFAPAFEEYYRSIDRFIGQTLVPFLDTKRGVNLVILYDHGFCRLYRDVFLNRWLE